MLYIKWLAHNKFIINGGPLSPNRDFEKKGTKSVCSLKITIAIVVILRTEIKIMVIPISC